MSTLRTWPPMKPCSIYVRSSTASWTPVLNSRILSSAVGAPPQLTDLGLYSCGEIEDGWSLWPLTTNSTARKYFYEHYIRVVSDTIHSMIRGTVIHTISLPKLKIPFYDKLKVLDMRSLEEALSKLPLSVQVLRLSD